MSETRVARIDEIAPGQCRAVRAGIRRIAVYNVNGNFFAIEDACGHMKASLSSGRLNGTTLTCSWHGWQYNVTTGACLDSTHGCLKRFALAVRNDEIFVTDEPIAALDDLATDEPDPFPAPVFRT